ARLRLTTRRSSRTPWRRTSAPPAASGRTEWRWDAAAQPGPFGCRTLTGRVCSPISMANEPRLLRGLASQSLGQELGDVLHLKIQTSRVGCATQVQDATGIVRGQHSRLGRSDIVQLSSGDAARDLRVVDRRAASKATAHIPLRQLDHWYAGPTEQL